MSSFSFRRWSALILTALSLGSTSVWAQEQEIRANLPKRLPTLPAIDEVRPTPVPGLYEVRLGADLLYTDAKGEFLLQGDLMDLKNQRSLTQERVNQLTAIDFKSLPFADSFKIVRGKGERQIAVFEDPNCGYCKRFEKELSQIDNVTVHLFLLPILGQDSQNKSRNLWCAADPKTAWLDWMLRDTPAAAPSGACDTAPLTRNVEFARKYKITGTPTIFFMDGTRVPGAISTAQLEENMTRAATIGTAPSKAEKKPGTP